MATSFTPKYINPQESEQQLIARIADAVSAGTQNLTTGGDAFDVNVVPSIGNGLPSVKSFTSSSLTGNNLVQVKTSAALLGSVLVNNTQGTDYFVSFFNDAAATNTTTPAFVLRARANTVLTFPLIPSGLNFTNGLAFGFTTTFGGTTLMGGTSFVDVALTYL
jgi:hypothetical protein